MVIDLSWARVTQPWIHSYMEFLDHTTLEDHTLVSFSLSMKVQFTTFINFLNPGRQ